MIAFKTRAELDSKSLLLHTLSVMTLLISLQVHIFVKKIAMFGKFTHRIQDLYVMLNQSACEKSVSILQRKKFDKKFLYCSFL